MKKFLQNLLASLSRRVIKKYHPIVIGITGSVGKTSVKEAVFFVVSEKYRARRSEKNFNNEFGLPFTILGVQAPGKNLAMWLDIFITAISLLLLKHRYPQVLVLEMGVDRAGDMDHLLSIVRPNFAIITSIGVSHLEFFKDIAAIAHEKGKIAQVLEQNEYLIINADNQGALGQKDKGKGKVLTYGISNPADVRLVDIRENFNELDKTTFTLIAPSRKFEASVRAFGETHLSSVAAACALAEALGIEADMVKKGLLEYRPAPGRQNIISGIKRSTIIDDSYNSAPDSAKAALKMLGKIPGNHKIAVLGDMLELGNASDEAHKEIGKIIAGMDVSKLITVGPGGKLIAEGAKAAGMEASRILSFDTSDEAKKPLQELLPPEAVVLVKGSQGMRMEKVTKEIMAEPMRATELLCRQYGKWQNK